jgi:hypothetical protein
MLGLEQAMMMQNVDVSSVHKVIYNYPYLTRHTSTLQWLIYMRKSVGYSIFCKQQTLEDRATVTCLKVLHYLLKSSEVFCLET